MGRTRYLPMLCLVWGTWTLAASAAEAPLTAKAIFGHSLHGEAFDEGPRQAAKILEGMGHIRLATSTKSAECQAFVNQGVAQLHTFYYFEAERSFRTAAKIDPQCAMAYWGMAMANENNEKRARAFLDKARPLAKTPREKAYIAAADSYFQAGRSPKDRRAAKVTALEKIVLDYPDDVEAKAFFAWSLAKLRMSGDPLPSKLAVDAIIAQVLSEAPNHPGAHHYRIHLWDDGDPKQALASSKAYGDAAPGIAHAWHMPGHIYNGLSRWEEAVYQQEASARVDHRRMKEDLVMPCEIFNYAHNQQYLIANLCHLGGVEEAIAFSRNLIEQPRDPVRNAPTDTRSAQSLGRRCLLKSYLRFEMWDELLNDPALDWSNEPEERVWKHYGRGMALLHLGKTAEAKSEADKLEAAIAEINKPKTKSGDAVVKPADSAPKIDARDLARRELRGRVLIAEGNLLDGFALMDDAGTGAKTYDEDLSAYPRHFSESLGFAHLAAKNWGLAEANFQKTLERSKSSLSALAGHAEALDHLGDSKKRDAGIAAFRQALVHADPDFPFIRRYRPQFHLENEETSDLPAESVVDGRRPLESLGPKLWTPNAMPRLSLKDSSGRSIIRSDLPAGNLVLVFYLGGDCPACVEQLIAFAKEQPAFEKLNAHIVAISGDSPERIHAFLNGAGKDIRFPVLSDAGHETAKRYRAYDDFEEFPIHGVVFIDANNKVRWLNAGVAPFKDLAFLKGEIERVSKMLTSPRGIQQERPHGSAN